MPRSKSSRSKSSARGTGASLLVRSPHWHGVVDCILSRGRSHPRCYGRWWGRHSDWHGTLYAQGQCRVLTYAAQFIAAAVLQLFRPS